jgi:hypothetical protein
VGKVGTAAQLTSCILLTSLRFSKHREVFFVRPAVCDDLQRDYRITCWDTVAIVSCSCSGVVLRAIDIAVFGTSRQSSKIIVSSPPLVLSTWNEVRFFKMREVAQLPMGSQNDVRARPSSANRRAGHPIGMILPRRMLASF